MRRLLSPAVPASSARTSSTTCSSTPTLGVTVLDKLTYAGNLASLDGLPADRFAFVRGDICDADAGRRAVRATTTPWCTSPPSRTTTTRCTTRRPFLDTNIIGTYTLLEAVAPARHPLPPHLHRRGVRRPRARRPGSGSPSRRRTTRPVPYSSTKAGSDLLVRAWVRSFGVRATISNCSNNYGPVPARREVHPAADHQRARRRPRPSSTATGENVRDWIHADDHSAAVLTIIDAGRASARPT